MTDQLTDQLHRRADDLPVDLSSASVLRNAAEQAQLRRRRGAVAAVAVVAMLIVGAGAVFRASGQGSVRLPADDTPTPTASTSDRGLLPPRDLPTGVPFGTWAGYRDLDDPAQGPFCVAEFAQAGAVSWQLRQFITDRAGVRGAQAIVEFGSVDQARHAGSTLPQVAICGPASATRRFATGLDGRGGGMAQTNGTGEFAQIVSLVWARSGQFVSVLWLSWHSRVLVTEDVQTKLMKLVREHLSEAATSLTAPPPSPAEKAMLDPADLPFAKTDDGTFSDLYGDPLTYWPLHSCDADVGDGAPLRESIFGDDVHGVVAGERLVVAKDPTVGHSMFTDLSERIRRCTTDEGQPTVTARRPMGGPAVGDESVGWSYDRRWSDRDQDTVYVVLARVGPVLVQVVRIIEQGDATPTMVEELASVAVDRVAAHVRELSGTAAGF